MGYLMVFGNCWSCGALFGFHPERVPSIIVEGEREPICRACIEAANPQRRELGLPEWVIHPDSYEPEQT